VGIVAHVGLNLKYPKIREKNRRRGGTMHKTPGKKVNRMLQNVAVVGGGKQKATKDKVQKIEEF